MGLERTQLRPARTANAHYHGSTTFHGYPTELYFPIPATNPEHLKFVTTSAAHQIHAPYAEGWHGQSRAC